MKDMFGRFISINDIVTYIGRQSSSTWLRIARVTSVSETNAHVNVVAGVGHQTYPYDAVIHTSHNVMVSNGIDAMGIAGLMRKRTP